MNYLEKFKILLLSLVLFIGLSFAGAYTPPTANPPSGNTAPPITSLSTSQYKTGSLAINKTSGPTTGYALDVIGSILATNLVVSSGASISGDIKVTGLATGTGNPDKKVCVDSTGKLIYCTGTSQTVTLWYPYSGEISTVTIPSGVKNNKIIVEMWGGGGAGFGNNSFDGGSSYFKRSFSPSYTIYAYGGISGKTTRAGGGYSPISAPNNVTYLTSSSGTNGGLGSSGQNHYTGTCGISYISFIQGGVGGAGGLGGGSGPTANVSGGNGGAAGNVGCPYPPMAIEGSNGGSSINGKYPGGGGSGWGGKGGYSGRDPNTHDPLEDYNGLNGVAGGGGGGYVKFEATVAANQQYTLKTGKGGFGNNYGETLSSSSGADGLIRITYELE